MYKVLISGATRGIGRALAIRLAEEGCAVAFCGKDEGRVEGFQTLLRQDYGIDAHGFVADMGSKEDVQAFALLAVQRLGGLDILVNNAGIFLPGAVGEEADGVFETLMAVNVAGAYHLTRAVLPELRKSQRAHIFNICSTASIMPYVNGGSYCISKFALFGMSKVLRAETMGSPIAVTAVLPGATLTDSWSGTGLPETRFMQAEDVAAAIWSAWTINTHSVVEELLVRPRAGDI